MKIPPELKEMSKRDLIRLILKQQELIEELIPLKERVETLEKRLLMYENPHTPPSQDRRYPKREKKERGKQGAPKGHKGVTRKTPEPNETKNLTLSCCPDCGGKLGQPKRVERRVIEEIPKPQPLRVIEFLIPHYHCNHCNKNIVATDPELPTTGNLGINLQAQIVSMKYEDRLPLRKTCDSLNRQYPGLLLTPATIYNVLQRVSDKLLPVYEDIKYKVRNSKISNADETSAKLDGKKHWFWVFMAVNAVLFLLRPGRNNKVVKEVFGENYQGILTCDGYKAYGMWVKYIQRCWAHLLREAEYLAEKFEGQARILYNSLCELFGKIKEVTIEAPKEIRQRIYDDCIKKMKFFIGIANKYTYLKKFAKTIENGLEHWFTCVLYPEIEPTNNKAERELREFVVQRKIFGSFRSKRGLEITECIMSVLATWRLRGQNTQEMLRLNLSS